MTDNTTFTEILTIDGVTYRVTVHPAPDGKPAEALLMNILKTSLKGLDLRADWSYNDDSSIGSGLRKEREHE